MSTEDSEIDAKKTTDFAVGPTLYRIRQDRGLSQRELARRAEMTNANLSMIEQGKVSPSIHTLEKILNAISMSLAEFFAGAGELSSPVIRQPEFATVRKCGVEYQFMQLSEGARPPFHFVKTLLLPGKHTTGEGLLDAGYVAGMVMDGELHLMLAGREYIVQTGEAYRFAAGRPYRLENRHASTPVVVVSFTSAGYA